MRPIFALRPICSYSARYAAALLIGIMLSYSYASATVWEYQVLNIGSTAHQDRGLYFRNAQVIYPVGSDILDLRVSPLGFFFDFEAPGSDVRLVYDDVEETIRIFGEIAETRVYAPWTAGTVANVRRELEGEWYLDFTYTENVVDLGDGNAYVEQTSALNTGTLTQTNGANVGFALDLFDKAKGNYSLASILQGAGGPNNGRGFTEGWLMLAAGDDEGRVGGTADFAFRTELIGSHEPPTEVPEPGSALLLLAAVGGALGKRAKNA